MKDAMRDGPIATPHKHMSSAMILHGDVNTDDGLRLSKIQIPVANSNSPRQKINSRA